MVCKVFKVSRVLLELLELQVPQETLVQQDHKARFRVNQARQACLVPEDQLMDHQDFQDLPVR